MLLIQLPYITQCIKNHGHPKEDPREASKGGSELDPKGDPEGDTEGDPEWDPKWDSKEDLKGYPHQAVVSSGRTIKSDEKRKQGLPRRFCVKSACHSFHQMLWLFAKPSKLKGFTVLFQMRKLICFW